MERKAWILEQDALAERYMRETIENPSAYDETNLMMIARLAERDIEYYKSWLFKERNASTILQATRPVRITE